MSRSGDRGLNIHLYPSNLLHESRMLRLTATLARWELFREIHLVGRPAPGLAPAERLDEARLLRRLPMRLESFLPRPLAKLALLEWLVRLFWRYRKADLACINAHSLTALPVGVALKAATGARLVYDTHELETETVMAGGLRRRLAKIAERRLIRRADAVVVVGDCIAEWYRRTYGLDNVAVVKNYPSRDQRAPAAAGMLRRRYAMSDDTLLFIYQGTISGNRGVEVILDAFSRSHIPHHVAFMGYGSLIAEVERHAARHPNIHYHPAVPPGEVLAHVRDADVGLVLIMNACLSYYYCCPNKLLECLSAGVPVIASDFPEMRDVVHAADAGWTIPPNADELAALVMSLDREKVAARKANIAGWGAAHNWEAQEPVLRAAYQRLGFKPFQRSKAAGLTGTGARLPVTGET